jgi:hypothetical protein
MSWSLAHSDGTIVNLNKTWLPRGQSGLYHPGKILSKILADKKNLPTFMGLDPDLDKIIAKELAHETR